MVERGGALSPLPLPTPASLATSLTLPPSSPLHKGEVRVGVRNGWRWQRSWWVPALQHYLPDRHAICSRQATSTPPLSLLPPPGSLPRVRGQRWLGEGTVRCAWRNGEVHLRTQNQDVSHPCLQTHPPDHVWLGPSFFGKFVRRWTAQRFEKIFEQPNGGVMIAVPLHSSLTPG